MKSFFRGLSVSYLGLTETAIQFTCYDALKRNLYKRNEEPSKLTLFGAVFLAILAVIPTLFTKVTKLTSTFSATGLLIMVSVALETAQLLEAQMMMRHYKGFLN